MLSCPRVPHKHTSDDDETILATDCLKLTLEDAIRRSVSQKRKPAITIESDETKITGLLIPNQTPGHGRGILRRKHPH